MLAGTMRTRVLSLLRRLLRRNDGQDLIEYGLLIGMLSVALVTSLGHVSGKVSTIYRRHPECAGRRHSRL
jgi:Flp pilus assembly pilin Flp